MHKDRLKEVLFDQQELFDQTRQVIPREIALAPYISTRQVVFITGVRRCGKSTLLYLLKEEMALEEGYYCYFNFDDERILADISLLDQLYLLHLELYERDPVLLFDEIQNIKGWEQFVNRMYEKGVKVFVTGSNANLLSSEIATSLTGRNKVLELYPFSFTEYLTYTGLSKDTEKVGSTRRAQLTKAFNNYIALGGFPLVVRENDLELINSYFRDILYRDIVARYHVTQVNELKQLGLYFASNISKLFSYKRLQELIGVKSKSTVKRFLEYYQQAYLFFYLPKFEYSIKKQVGNPKKVYAIDSSIANRLGFHFSQNKGRVLENIIFIELLRRQKEIFYHAGRQECDFVIKEKMEVTAAIQVTWTIDRSNASRELNGLKEAMNTYDLDRGTLITMEVDLPEADWPEDNILVIPAWKWLMKGREETGEME